MFYVFFLTSNYGMIDQIKRSIIQSRNNIFLLMNMQMQISLYILVSHLQRTNRLLFLNSRIKSPQFLDEL